MKSVLISYRLPSLLSTMSQPESANGKIVTVQNVEKENGNGKSQPQKLETQVI